MIKRPKTSEAIHDEKAIENTILKFQFEEWCNKVLTDDGYEDEVPEEFYLNQKILSDLLLFYGWVSNWNMDL